MDEILFLAHRVPFPPNRGDKIRSANLLRKLATLAPVHVGCFAENAEDRAGASTLIELAKSHRVINRSKPLVLAGVEAVLSGKPVSLTAFHNARLADWVRETVESRNIGTIVVFSGQMGQYIPDDFNGQVIVDLCDVDSAKFESYATAGDRVWLNKREGRLLARAEERLARRADATILISEAEAELFVSRLQFPSMANVKVIGNGIDSVAFDPDKVEYDPRLAARKGPHFVFTGQMDYPPNEAACLWAIEHFLPAVRNAVPDAELHVVGRNPTSALLAKRGTDGLSVWGEVPDIRPYIAAADCVIAPLMIARGVQNKVLEAMAMAKPVMLTPQAATGIAANDGEHWLLCEADADAMCKRAVELLENRDQAFDIGSAARRFVLTHHVWSAMLEPLEELVTGKGKEARNAA